MSVAIRGRHEETPPAVELLAEGFYLAVMQATSDHWVIWERAAQTVRSGYYDLAYEMAEKISEATI